MSGREQHDGEGEHRDLPPRRAVGRLHDVLLGGVAVDRFEDPDRDQRHELQPDAGEEPRDVGEPGAAPVGGSRGRSRCGASRVPLRRATIASQAMIAKFCAQISDDERRRACSGGRDRPRTARRPPRPDPDRERGDGVADRPAHDAGVHPDRRRRTRGGGGGGGGGVPGQAEAAEGGRCSLPGTLAVRARNPRTLGAVAPGTLHSGRRPGLPLRGTRRRAVAWSDRRRGAGPRMSRRQTDLEPGVEPDAGETSPTARRTGPMLARPLPRRRGDPNAARRPAERRTAARPEPPERRPTPPQAAVAHRRCAGCPGRPRADRRRVHRQQPRGRRLVQAT